MATKDYSVPFELQSDQKSNYDSSQFSNLNLNQNHKCSKINSFQSKTISNKNNNERTFNAAALKISSDYKNNNPRENVNDFVWNKSEKQQQLSLKLDESSNFYDSKKKDNAKNNNSTLSLHIVAYENAIIEAGGNKSNTNLSIVEKADTSKFGKALKNVKQHFVQSSSSSTKAAAIASPFEIPRQQDDTPKTPEVMQFKSSKKLLNPNDTNNVTPKAKSPEIEPPASSAWSWLPSIFSSIFISKPPEKKLYESSPSAQQPSPTSPLQKPPSINENHEKVSGFPAPTVTIPPLSPPKLLLSQPDADEKCSRGNGDASPQSSAERFGMNKSKEVFSTAIDLKIKKNSKDNDTIASPKASPSREGAKMISVNLEEGHIADSMQKELMPQSEPIFQKLVQSPPKLKDIFELEVATSPGAVTTEPAIKPKCSFNRVSFSRSHTVYFLPNTKQRLHKKVVRSRHDAWRRYGALMVIHKRGGWSYTMNGKAKNFQKVEKNTPLPPAPVLPPILTEEEFHKRPIITVPSASKSKRQKQQQEKKENKGDTDTSVSDEDPPSC